MAQRVLEFRNALLLDSALGRCGLKWKEVGESATVCRQILGLRLLCVSQCVQGTHDVSMKGLHGTNPSQILVEQSACF